VAAYIQVIFQSAFTEVLDKILQVHWMHHVKKLNISCIDTVSEFQRRKLQLLQSLSHCVTWSEAGSQKQWTKLRLCLLWIPFPSYLFKSLCKIAAVKLCLCILTLTSLTIFYAVHNNTVKYFEKFHFIFCPSLCYIQLSLHHNFWASLHSGQFVYKYISEWNKFST
jgi:hypothetical protein